MSADNWLLLFMLVLFFVVGVRLGTAELYDPDYDDDDDGFI